MATSAPTPESMATHATGSDAGLSEAEAASRLRQYGPNEVAEPATHPLRRFLGKFWGLSAWMLELILGLSLLLHKTSDFLVVAVLLLFNAGLGFAQEQRAAGVMRALRQRLQVRSRVLRAGRWQLLAARELVPGDLVRLRAGDLVPADLQLVEGTLGVDQSALTGESGEVERTAGEALVSGAVVRRGEATARVLRTGARTYYGRTTELVQQARPRLHIEAVVARVVRWLFAIVGTLLAAVAVVSPWRGTPLLDMAPLLLVLLMSAVPVALPAMFTVSMAVGSRELARHGVLVTRLSAAEDAATMNVLCVDKTGTITQNLLAVAAVLPREGVTAEDVLRAAALASQEADQDPIDLAFLAAARARQAFDGQAGYTPVSFTPFDARTRRTEAVLQHDGQTLRVMKGAVRTVAAACGLDEAAIAALEEEARAATRRGQRVLAVAGGPAASMPALLGLVTLVDPLRPDAAQLIAELRDLGVQVKMLTGDALPVAREIAREVGLIDIRRVDELKAAGTQGPAAVSALLARSDGFAEVYPEDKYTVVQQLQAAGHVTGMTGDGVNDAPALRQAEVGIAVSSATDVAKSAASVVLTEAGLTNIVALVGQGRMIYQRVLTWIINKISRTILKSGFVALAYLLTGQFVVSAFAMLLLTFMTDFAKIAIATDRVRPSRRPESWAIGGFVAVATVLGLLMVAEALVLLWWAWTHFGLSASEPALHTFSFLLLLYLAVVSIVSARERRRFWASRPSPLLLGALLADAGVGTALTYLGLPSLAPLPEWQVLVVLVYALLVALLINDSVKVLLMRRWAPASLA